MKKNNFDIIKKSITKTKFVPIERIDRLFTLLKDHNEIAYYRYGSFADEVIFNGVRNYYFKGKRSDFKHGWIFREVKKQALGFVANNQIIAKEHFPPFLFNKNFVFKDGEFLEKTITGFDIDDAYWNIAFNMGMIKERTFRMALELNDEYKGVKLAALANLCSDKIWRVIENGEVNKRKKPAAVFKCDPLAKIAYNNIRFTCYEYLFNLSKLLGNDFYQYRVDCIEFRKTPETIKLVKNYFKKLNISASRLFWK